MSVPRNHRAAVRTTVYGRQPFWRSALRSMLESAGVGPVTTCSLELSSVADDAFRPQLLVADADGVAGFVDELRRLKSLLPHLTVIVVSEETDPKWAKGLAAAGAVDVIAKHAEVEEIEQALLAAIDRRLEWSRLTAREIEILDLVARGGSNREVGAALWLSDQTVKFHLANVYRKLGVASRAAAVARARAAGVLDAPISDIRADDDTAVAAAVSV
jgi:DNA-binding NarL/FixJ family response regulator